MNFKKVKWFLLLGLINLGYAIWFSYQYSIHLARTHEAFGFIFSFETLPFLLAPFFLAGNYLWFFKANESLRLRLVALFFGSWPIMLTCVRSGIEGATQTVTHRQFETAFPIMAAFALIDSTLVSAVGYFILRGVMMKNALFLSLIGAGSWFILRFLFVVFNNFALSAIFH